MPSVCFWSRHTLASPVFSSLKHASTKNLLTLRINFYPPRTDIELRSFKFQVSILILKSVVSFLKFGTRIFVSFSSYYYPQFLNSLDTLPDTYTSLFPNLEIFFHHLIELSSSQEDISWHLPVWKRIFSFFPHFRRWTSFFIFLSLFYGSLVSSPTWLSSLHSLQTDLYEKIIPTGIQLL